jgi:hypothetical protein
MEETVFRYGGWLSIYIIGVKDSLQGVDLQLVLRASR